MASSSSRYETVQVEQVGSIATVWLSRPPVNAVNRQMFNEITSAFSELSERSDVAVAILASHARHFCAGTDLHDFAAMTPRTAGERNRQVRAAFQSIVDCAVPVIAAVHGVCLGSGVAMAASCDFVVASDDARFGLPEVSVGVMGGARHLARLVPQGVVRRMFYTSEQTPAAVLARYGGIVEVVSRDELMARTHEIASMIGKQNIKVLRVAKVALNTIETMPLKEGYEFEQGLTAHLSGNSEARAALADTMHRLG